jgi:hypothetical protein
MSRLERLPRRSDRPLDVHAAARGGVRYDLPGRGASESKVAPLGLAHGRRG